MSLLEKSSVYEQPSVYNQGGGGGGSNVPFDPYYIRSTYVENNSQTFIVDNEKIKQEQNNKSTFGIGPTSLAVPFADINEFEIAFHGIVKSKYPTYNHGETWIICCGYNAESDSWIDNPMLGFFVRKNSSDNYARTLYGNSYVTLISNPQIYDQEKRIRLKYVRSEARLYTYIDNSTTVSNINASELDAKTLRVGFGVIWNYDQGIMGSSTIFNAGTFVKINGSLIWGHEE